METDRLTVLVIEDDHIEARATVRALSRRDAAGPIRVAGDGAEALELLRATGDRAITRPCLILLDINMPVMDGHEFLAELRSDPTLRRSVVVMLTTSAAPGDIARAYDQQVAGYVVKTDLDRDHTQLIQLVDGFAVANRFPYEDARP